MSARIQEQEARANSLTVARALRGVMVALGPPLMGFVGEKLVFAALGSRWLLMVAAVIISAAKGGMLTGIVATITSAALVWWYIIPPVQTLGAADSRYYLAVALFLAVGYSISLLHERLRRTANGLAQAARQNHIFAALIENSVDFIGIADPQGTPIYVNPAGRRMVELPEGAPLESTRIPEYYPPELGAFVQDTIVANMLTKGRWVGETSFRNWRTGAPIPVLDTHFLIRDPVTRLVIGMGTITRDISAQKAQRDELERINERLVKAMHDVAEAQRFLQGVLDYSPNAIVIKSVDGRYLIVNNGFGTITHHGPEEVRGKNDAELFPTALAQHLQRNDEIALTTRTPVVTEETVQVEKDQRTFLVTKFPLLDDAGRIMALGGIWTDITTLKDLQRLRDEWTSVIAHDLRQPIGAILMASDLLTELCRAQPNETAPALAERVHTAAGSLRRMVDDLLDMSLLEAKQLKLERRWTNPHELVHGTLDRLAHVPGIERVRVREEGALPRIFVDPVRIEQVLSNIVGNAIKYGDEHADVIVQLEQRDNEVSISITNRGRGIASEELPRLFDRFMRSKATRGSGTPGLGLGLYIAKGVIDAHGGRLSAESTPGETTTFRCALPVSAEQREAA